MAQKKRTVDISYGTPPETLDGHPFFGLECDDAEQIIYRDALWNKDIHFVGVDACAGSGKTTLAVAVGIMYAEYGIVDEIMYIRTPSSEGRIGFLPGTKEEKEKPYMQPLFCALTKLGFDPLRVVNDDSMLNQKNGSGLVTCLTDTYMLGSDYDKKFVIIDEAQNLTTDQLRAVITRFGDNSYVCCCGSSLQHQGITAKESGFKHCLDHFSQKPWAKICTLSKNYRGEMSAWADKL